MRRVQDTYPDEIRQCENPMIRTFKITEHTDYHGPLSELCSGAWVSAQPQTILDFSAAAYFFARETVRLKQVPVGLINASLGGSRIESWMSRSMLEGYDELLAYADRYADDVFIEAQKQKNMEQMQQWHTQLDQKDSGLQQHWEKEEMQTEKEEWQPITLPVFFKDTKLAGLIGSVWLRRTFEVSQEMAEQDAKLWLGTMVDSDVVYVNGIEVGHTDYQYPPRKYTIPTGVLRPGCNTIVIRLKCENGYGRVTPGKRMAVWNDDEEIRLDGCWFYRIGAVCEAIPPTDFVNWKPTGLYHGMMAPCHKYPIAGILWYQAEANAHMPECLTYADRMKRLIAGYREAWADPQLPFLYVQLPNFQIECYHGSAEEGNSCWAPMREQQRLVQEIPGTGMVTAIDLGEDNDLHPLNKKEIGVRLARLAQKMEIGRKEEAQGPEPEQIICEKWDPSGTVQLRLQCRNCAGGLYADSADKGKEVLDVVLAEASGHCVSAQVSVQKDALYLEASGLQTPPVQVQYCYSNANKGALIYNGYHLPMSPFVKAIEGAVYETVME